MIKHKSFAHLGGYYHYRIHQLKGNELCNNGHSNLKEYLDNLFRNCPNNYFDSGPRSSGLKITLKNIKLHHVKNHEVCALAKEGLEVNSERYMTGHSKVQVFMLENDNKTIAVEIPLWMREKEHPEFKKLFKSIKPLTGHIDILRIEDNNIWVWDYKPKARREKFASAQVYFYSLMLSKRANIPLESFKCGYFDDKDSFIFDPNRIIPERQSLFGLL